MAENFDLLIRGGTLVDGTGAAELAERRDPPVLETQIAAYGRSTRAVHERSAADQEIEILRHDPSADRASRTGKTG